MHTELRQASQHSSITLSALPNVNPFERNFDTSMLSPTVITIAESFSFSELKRFSS